MMKFPQDPFLPGIAKSLLCSALCLAFSPWIAAPAKAQETQTVLKADSVKTEADAVYLSGHASVTRDGTAASAQNITYRQDADTVELTGDASISRKGLTFTGPKASYNLAEDTAQMRDASFTYEANSLRGHTKNLTYTAGETTEFSQTRLTTCPADEESWWIQADHVEIDDATQYAYIKNAGFYFGGVPMAKVPWLAIPATNQRTTGFLVPSFGYGSSKGLDITLPFYWNIAPNYDYTFTPHLMTKRGVILGNEFRLLEENFKGSFTYDWLPHDSETGSSRYYAGVKINGNFSGLSYYADYNKVSDGQYLQDFSDNIYDDSRSILAQNFGMSYAWEHFSTSLEVNMNQALERSNGTRYAKPYEKKPQWQGRMYFADVGGFEIEGLAEATRFTHPDKANYVQGNRFYMNEAVSYPMRGSWWFATPKAQITGVAYSLDKMGRLNGSRASRYDKHSDIFVPTVSFDTGLYFDREFEWGGNSFTQTLEPRIFYAYTAHKDQSRMPTFDGSLPDLSFGGLFSENLFSGHDKISHTNSVTTALTSRIHDRSGYEWIRASIGQRYYFDDQDVSLYAHNGKGVTTKHTPDWLGALDFNLTKTVHFTSAAQYSREKSRVTRANVGVRWHPRPSSVVGLYYRYNYAPETPDEHMKQIDASIQWPINEKLYALARYNYSLYESQMVEALVGLEYVRKCWSMRLIAQRYLKDNDRYDNNFFIQLELRGLGSVGSNPMSTIRQSIPGYEETSFNR